MIANVFSRFQMHQKDLKRAKEVNSTLEEIHKFYLFQSDITENHCREKERFENVEAYLLNTW